MILASGNVKDFEENSRMILELFIPLKELMAALENVRNDYQSANIELSSLAQILSSSEKEQLELMKSRVDELSDELMQKVDASLEKIHNHYHIASNEVSPTVSELAKRTKLNLYNEGKYE
jgi:predicted nuclease with TOPRIM domain